MYWGRMTQSKRTRTSKLKNDDWHVLNIYSPENTIWKSFMSNSAIKLQSVKFDSSNLITVHKIYNHEWSMGVWNSVCKWVFLFFRFRPDYESFHKIYGISNRHLFWPFTDFQSFQCRYKYLSVQHLIANFLKFVVFYQK